MEAGLADTNWRNAEAESHEKKADALDEAIAHLAVVEPILTVDEDAAVARDLGARLRSAAAELRDQADTVRNGRARAGSDALVFHGRVGGGRGPDGPEIPL